MHKDFLLIPEESKLSLSQACSQGLQVGKYPPIQVIVHFQNNSVVKTRLSVAPVFSCLFLSAGSHKAMQEILLLCTKYAQKTTLPISSYINTSILSEKQQRILNCIADVPFGETCTYQDIAKETHTHPRTVGMACKHNPFLLFFPCHRILSSNGERHYCAGEQIQNILLRFEGSLR
ncbi:Methylated-DNA--protein-cysteine methyltransferase [Chlamydia avium]|uniref:Methylated-DNA-[]-cysteine S-methyltransferase family protein n=2 Tax=Chlamydia avium TaxID=1457141 RepID=W8JSH7_9CHLA|nr:methylated-DNA--[protein]-cysteine S-methyltransferase [Chlamydia avium]AHK63793.1 Methylated-DNA-[]-cysteine S-methyltransferase family protein [Chlamydia avium 10DC88]EPP36551.1 methylated-DNA-[]-cysteine S-methyltransferase family protein [Chlamydia psittaci 10_743_SC13]EPP38668.1 methylated-DNA-[]-cysteine S-methyltransferase family protein [Chlamydia avium]VVT43374.1 Methylated-DNA--protein-cysteine methyltransferase [Chlamydia avium]